MSKPDIAQVLLMAHGWGYNHRFFNAFLDEVPTQTRASTLIVCLEAGYFPEQAMAGLMVHTHGQWIHHPAETLHSLVLAHAEVPWLGLGHSMGFSKLLDFSVRWHSLFCVHGFTRFVRAANETAGTAPRVMNTMLRKAQQNLPEVLMDFHARCGHNASWATLNAQSLLADLASLQTLNLQNALQGALAQGTELHAWGSEQDAIAPATLQLACFGEALSKQDRGLYMVPAGHAEFAHTPTRYTDTLLPLLGRQ